MSENNRYFQHSMSENQFRKPVRKLPQLWTRNESNTENKAYNGKNIFDKLFKLLIDYLYEKYFFVTGYLIICF